MSINPNAFITVADFEADVLRGSTSVSSAQSAMIAEVILATTAMMESSIGTGRKLAARAYTAARTATTCTVSGTAVTGGDSGTQAVLAAARVGEDVVTVSGSGGVAIGTRITGVSGSTLTISPSGTNGACSLSIGSREMLLDGNGERDIWLPEWPLNALYSAYWRDGLGNWTALNTSNAEIDYENGYIRLFNDVFYVGRRNIKIEANCGYVQPSTTAIGHPAEWGALRRAAIRLASHLWQQWSVQPGVFDSVSMGQASGSVSGNVIPVDVQAMLAAFARAGR